ncbi:MAG: RNA chaperone Hfq [Holosporales bacterium]|jgi:host factor-I protein|nr:RNA chaperone Hfq [Holosporales bacterium]
MARDSKVYEKFVGNLVSGKVPVVIFLVNGVKLQGVISDFDEISIVLVRDQNVQILCRQVVSTIIPQSRSDS